MKNKKNLLADPKYTLYAIYDEDTDDIKRKKKYIKAIIAVFHFDDFAFIEHFAVNPIYRNQGLGSIILNELKTALDCQICLEVELPETENAKKTNRLLRTQRLLSQQIFTHTATAFRRRKSHSAIYNDQ